jgi:hypothetical protein
MNNRIEDSEFGTIPIVGTAVCAAISTAWDASDLCVVKFLDTMCNNAGLADLQRRVLESHHVEISVEKLIDALSQAVQIIDLTVQLVKEPQRHLVIEDGDLWDNSL